MCFFGILAVLFSFIHIYGKHKKRGIMEVYIWENSVFIWLKLRLWSKCRSSPVFRKILAIEPKLCFSAVLNRQM